MNTTSNFGRGRPEIEAKRLEGLRRSLADPVKRQNHRDGCINSHKSGKRKPRSPESYANLGEKIKAGYRNGTRREDPEKVRQTAIANLAKASREKQAQAARRLAEKRKGLLMPICTKEGKPSRAAKSSRHWASKVWWFRRHDGAEIKGRNLSELIRQNTHLFHPNDVVWKKTTCRARAGLSSLTWGRVNGPTTWKGWTVVWTKAPGTLIERELNP